MISNVRIQFNTCLHYLYLYYFIIYIVITIIMIIIIIYTVIINIIYTTLLARSSREMSLTVRIV